VTTRSRKLPASLIVAGLLVALVHLTLAVTGAMTTAQWISGIAIGLLIAGVGNHIRLFGRR
jgi:hypothetical protein